MPQYERSELLTLLNNRKCWEPAPPYKLPTYNKGVVERAERVHVKANDSDPYAGDRIRLHLLMGFELPSNVEKDATAQLARRATEHKEKPRGDLAVLATMKRKLDEDRAWNQYNSQQFLEDKKH